MTYTARCLDQEPAVGAKVCRGLGLGETVNFDLSIQAKDCSQTGPQRYIHDKDPRQRDNVTTLARQCDNFNRKVRQM